MTWFDKKYIQARCGFILDKLPNVHSKRTYTMCLDIGGGDERLGDKIWDKGYIYTNIDPKNNTGRAEDLEQYDEEVHLVIMKDSLEHIEYPKQAFKEAHRVLKPGGLLIGLVPWMHPFHGTDLWRFSHLGLMQLGKHFSTFRCETPLGFWSVLGIMLGPSSLRLLGMWLDSFGRKKLRSITPFIIFIGEK